ncbi:hypothetical protein [uncultured Sphingobacterium sp.]|uniref:hypothetical protein n=1 Tax=uncultured Sphingobacterium sp. TaxID=182688 RepID=UPI0025F5BB4C|nr:hypothetical protein [uncultured Sphingobacterium sp.]
MRYILYVLFFILNVVAYPCIAQEQSSYTIRGCVKNQEGLPVKSATVAAYGASDSVLIAYSLTGPNGKFDLKKIAIEKEVRLIITHVSYSKYIIQNIKGSKDIDLQDIKLKIRELLIDSVDVKPPVYMNKDTLEFNADAFKLEPEAVVEDLLRKLPGVIVWGDGEITVNGKKVKNVFVNGKKFFTGDAKIATQNLAKNIVEKVQVYQTEESRNNTQDSSYHMNLVLKKGKSAGVFGKVMLGAGTDKKNEQSGNVNYYNLKSQLSIGGNRNNVNFQPASMDALLKNSTFKGNLIERLLQSDFNLDGINRSTMEGVFFQHDFKYHRTEERDRNQLEVDVFRRNFDNSTTRMTNTTDFTEAGTLSYIAENENESSNRQSRIGLKYNLKKQGKELLFTLNNRSDAQTSTVSDLQNSVIDDKKLSLLQNTSLLDKKNKATEAKLYLSGYNMESEQIYLRENQSLSSEVQSLFEDFNAKTSSLNERHKNEHITSDSYKGNLKVYLSELLKLGNYKDSRSLKVELNNTWNYRDMKINQHFLDLDTSNNQFFENIGLDNSRSNKEFLLISGVNVNKRFEKNFDGRYKKTLIAKMGLNGIYYNSLANGSREVQRFRINNSYLKPFFSLYAEDIRFGRQLLSQTLDIEYKKNFVDYEQRVYVVDSVGAYNYRIANPSLINGDMRRISLKTNYINFNHRFFIDQGELTLDYNQINKPVIDSLVYSTSGKSTTYLINGDKGWSASFKLMLKKAITLSDNSLQVYYKTNGDLFKNPSYIGGEYYKTKNTSLYLSGGGLFSTDDGKWTIRLDQDLNFYRTLNVGTIEQRFKTNDFVSTVALSVQLIKSISLSTSMKYRNNSFMGENNTIFINNLSCNFRFAKNQAELELLAMDLFNQNKKILNRALGNSIDLAKVNTLNQYLMLSLSYYPRYFFGKKSK